MALIRSLLSVFLLSLFLTFSAEGNVDPMTVARANAFAKEQPVLVEVVSKKTSLISNLNEIYIDPLVSSVLRENYFQGPFSKLPLSQSSIITGERRVKEENSYLPAAIHPLAGVMRIAIEDYPEISSQWEIKGVPMFLIISPDGNISARHEGIMNAIEMSDFLKSGIPEKVKEKESLYEQSEEVVSAPSVAPAPLTAIPWREEMPREPVVNVAATAEPSSASAVSSQPINNAVSPKRNVIRDEFIDSSTSEFLYERRFDAPTLCTLQLKTLPEDYDLDLEVLDAEGKTLILSEEKTGIEKIELAVGEGTSYTIRVFSFRGDPTGVKFELKENTAPLPNGRLIPSNERSEFATANAISMRLLRNDDYWIRFILTPMAKYKFSVDASNLRGGDVDLKIIMPNGILLSTVKSSDGAQIADIPDAGRVFLLLSPASGRPKGIVNIKAERYLEVDQNNVDKVLELGRSISDKVGGQNGSSKVYQLNIPQRGTYDLNLAAENEDADIDLEVIKADGTLVTRSESPAGQENITIELDADEAYYARVYVYRNSTSIPFTLTLNEKIDTGYIEGNSNPEPPAVNDVPPADATQLAESQKERGSIGANEFVWYRLVSDRDGLFAVFIDGDEDANDIDIALYKSDGTQLVISQTNFAREAILWDAKKGEEFFIKVYSYGVSQGGRFKVWYQNIER